MKIAREYASALFALAAEKGCQDEYYNALSLINEVFVQTPEYIQFLSSAGIPLEERLESLEEAFSSALPEEVMSFIELVCEKGHAKYIHQCILEYKQLLDSTKEIKTAKVVSAVKLSNAEKTALKEKLELKFGSKVILDCIIDKSVLGGICVEIDGKVTDGTLRRRLKDIRDVISR